MYLWYNKVMKNRSVMHEKNEVSNKYDITLLTAFFIGPLGIHRIINKHYITGFILLSLSTIAFITSFWFATLPIAVLIFVAIFIWRFIDVILILMGKFKDEFGNYITYGDQFFESKSNIVVITMFIVEAILLFIVLVFIFSLITLFISMGVA